MGRLARRAPLAKLRWRHSDLSQGIFGYWSATHLLHCAMKPFCCHWITQLHDKVLHFGGLQQSIAVGVNRGKDRRTYSLWAKQANRMHQQPCSDSNSAADRRHDDLPPNISAKAASTIHLDIARVTFCAQESMVVFATDRGFLC